MFSEQKKYTLHPREIQTCTFAKNCTQLHYSKMHNWTTAKYVFAPLKNIKLHNCKIHSCTVSKCTIKLLQNTNLHSCKIHNCTIAKYTIAPLQNM